MARLACAILLLIAVGTTLSGCLAHDSLPIEIYTPEQHLDPGTQ
jgi:hypothetical protein